MQLYNKILLVIINVFGFMLGIYFVYNGVINGIIRKKIIVRNPDNYSHGSNALKLGVVQLVLGVFVIVFSLVFSIAILKDFF